ncbi:MAG: hypothetical protein HFI93_04010 [Lachnospiraceae bacterium]|nr:hypothetical protein [Lachnospiraceae bacterium]
MSWSAFAAEESRNFVFLGEAGCGKSELAVNLACYLADRQSGEDAAIHFFDMDQTKPLMRSRDTEGFLKEKGIRVHYEVQFADAPVVVGGVETALRDEKAYTILDVGGNDTGARLIGGFSGLLRTAQVFFVVNPYRPWSATLEHIDQTLSAILRASRLPMPRFLLNPNLGEDTTAEEYREGFRTGLALLAPHVKVEGAAVPAGICEAVREEISLPLIPVTRRMASF